MPTSSENARKKCRETALFFLAFPLHGEIWALTGLLSIYQLVC